MASGKNLVVVKELKSIIQQKNVIERYNDFFDNSQLFLEGVLNTVVQNKSLQKCSVGSIMNAAMVSATMKLPVNNQLGYGYLVPYKGDASFQIGYKGIIQLAIRTNEYKNILATEVYKDEFVSYNHFTGELDYTIHDGLDCDRYNKGEIVGYYVSFLLKNGFKAELFASHKSLMEFAEEYSEAYKYDLSKGYKYSPWSTNSSAMCKKTLLKRLLKTFGVLSIDLVNALSNDEEPYNKEEEPPEVITPLGEEVKQADCPI
jgi:recombination protein RecT